MMSKNNNCFILIQITAYWKDLFQNPEASSASYIAGILFNIWHQPIPEIEIAGILAEVDLNLSELGAQELKMVLDQGDSMSIQQSEFNIPVKKEPKEIWQGPRSCRKFII